MAIPVLIFLLGTVATSVATVSLVKDRRRGSEQPKESASKPTIAVMVVMIGTYTWMLTIAMHIFRAFFKNGPGTFKYYLTLGIAVSATIFMQVYGKRVVRQHYGTFWNNERLVLSGAQALYITLLILVLSVYFVWVLN